MTLVVPPSAPVTSGLQPRQPLPICNRPELTLHTLLSDSNVLRHVHNFRVGRDTGGISLTVMDGGSASRIAIHASKNAE